MEVVNENIIQKRGRGRPRKNAIVQAVPQDQNAEEIPIIKKPRGRPKIYQYETYEEQREIYRQLIRDKYGFKKHVKLTPEQAQENRKKSNRMYYLKRTGKLVE